MPKTFYLPAAGYSGMPQAGVAAFTAAAFAETGFILVSKKNGLRPAKGEGNLAVWSAIVGPTASRYWRSKGWIANDGITEAGISRLQERLSKSGYYRTSTDLIAAFRKALRKGGTVRVGDREIAFTREIGI